MKKKLKIVAVIFLTTIIVGVIDSITNFSAIPEVVGSDWLTKNNTGLLSEMGVKWWEGNHDLLVFAQVVTLIFGFLLIGGLMWAVFVFFEMVCMLGYSVLANRHNRLEGTTFETFIMESFISMLDFEDGCYYPSKSVFVNFFAIIMVKILFFK